MKALKFFNKWIFPLVMIVLIWIGAGALWGILAIVAYICFVFWKKRKSFFLTMATIEHNKQELVKSAYWLERAYFIDKNDASVVSTSAYVLMKLGKLEKASMLLENIDKSKLNDQELFLIDNSRAMLAWKQSRLEEALEILESYYEKGFLNTTLYDNYAYYLLAARQYEKGLKIAKEAYEFNKESISILENLARAYQLNNEPDLARQCFQALIEKNPEYPEAWYNIGKWQQEIGDVGAALESFERALRYKFTFLTNVTIEEIQKEIENAK